MNLLRNSKENIITKDCKESVQMTAFIPPDKVYITALNDSNTVYVQTFKLYSAEEQGIKSFPTVLSNKSDPQSGILITVEKESAVKYESASRCNNKAPIPNINVQFVITSDP